MNDVQKAAAQRVRDLQATAAEAAADVVAAAQQDPYTKLTELHCMVLAERFAPAWKLVAVTLGFDYWEIVSMSFDNINSTVTMKAAHMLMKWVQRNYDNATVEHLVAVLATLKI